MGMPFTNYSLFQALSADGDTANESFFPMDRIHAVLDKYNLYAFIIHDPITHPDFDKNINQTFEELDRISGGKLIFFSLVNPSSRWISIAKEREYFREFYNYEYIQSKDSSFTAYSLAQMLSIPEEDLPCIFVTNDFRKKEFRYFKSTTVDLVNQMKDLGQFALNTPEVKLNLDIIDDRLNSNTINIQKGIIEFDTSIAKVFSNLLAFIPTDLNFQNRTRNNWQIILKAKNKFLQFLKRRGDSRVEQFSLIINNLIAELHDTHFHESKSFMQEAGRSPYKNQTDYYSKDEFINFNFKSPASIDEILKQNQYYFELQTIRFIKSAIASYYLYKRLDDDYDYSTVNMGLSMGFENEINLSIVQWVRLQKGIEMPQYFEKVKPNFTAKIIPHQADPKPIDFNNGYKDKLFHPELGKSCLATKTVAEMTFPTEWEEKKYFESYLSHWEGVYKLRNKAAHPEPVSLNDCDRLITLFAIMARKDWFKKMFHLKNMCRGIIADEH